MRLSSWHRAGTGQRFRTSPPAGPGAVNGPEYMRPPPSSPPSLEWRREASARPCLTRSPPKSTRPAWQVSTSLRRDAIAFLAVEDSSHVRAGRPGRVQVRRSPACHRQPRGRTARALAGIGRMPCIILRHPSFNSLIRLSSGDPGLRHSGGVPDSCTRDRRLRPPRRPGRPSDRHRCARRSASRSAHCCGRDRKERSAPDSVT